MEAENQIPLDGSEIEAPAVPEAVDALSMPEPSLPTTRKKSHKRSIIIFVVVSLLNVGLLGLLWSQLITPAPAGASDPLVGQRAPNFRLSALNVHGGASSASTVSLADFQGKPIVLNVWSSSCAPCVREASIFQTQWQQLQPQGVVFLGLDFEDAQKDALSFLQKYGITYPNVIDADGSISVIYGVTGTPETIFINRQGIVVNRIRGELTAQKLQSNVQTLLP